MNRSLFTRIVRDLSANCPYFQEGCDAVGKAGISALEKSTSASLDEYLQIGEKTSRDCLTHFRNGVIELYGEEHLRRPTKLTSKNSKLFTRTNMGFLVFYDIIYFTNFFFSYAFTIYGFGARFFGVAGSINDVLFKSSLFYMILKWAVLMKSISQPGSNDVMRIRYKQAHEAARKDVERAFGVLKKK
ncbi:WAT1-related protein isoform X1 [Tanacetum coccineum]